MTDDPLGSSGITCIDPQGHTYFTVGTFTYCMNCNEPVEDLPGGEADV